MPSVPRIGMPLVIIPAAGSSKRFKDVGIDVPKGLIHFNYKGVGPKPMIGHILDPVARLHYKIVSSDPSYKVFAEENFQLVSPTRGQAETVLRGCEGLDDQPVVIMNCDVKITYPLTTFIAQCQWAEVGMLVFDGHGSTAYSYIDHFPNFMMCREKQPISRWAIAGVYYFQSSVTLCNVIREQITHKEQWAGEFYLSGAMKYFSGPAKLAVAMDPGQFHDWGTPEDLARDKDVDFSGTLAKILESMR